MQEKNVSGRAFCSIILRCPMYKYHNSRSVLSISVIVLVTLVRMGSVSNFSYRCHTQWGRISLSNQQRNPYTAVSEIQRMSNKYILLANYLEMVVERKWKLLISNTKLIICYEVLTFFLLRLMGYKAHMWILKKDPPLLLARQPPCKQTKQNKQKT